MESSDDQYNQNMGKLHPTDVNRVDTDDEITNVDMPAVADDELDEPTAAGAKNDGVNIDGDDAASEGVNESNDVVDTDGADVVDDTDVVVLEESVNKTPEKEGPAEAFVPLPSSLKKPNGPPGHSDLQLDYDDEHNAILGPQRPASPYWKVIHILPDNSDSDTLCGAIVTIEGFIERPLTSPFFDVSANNQKSKKYVKDIDAVPWVFEAKHPRH